MARGIHAAILGTGSALGDRLVTSASLDEAHGLEAGTVAKRSGVTQRYWCETEDQITLGVTAAKQALEVAGLTATDLDVILHAAAVPYQAIPATAPLIQKGLGLSHSVSAFDVNATCLSFLAGLGQAAAMIETGRWRHVLLVSSERGSRGLDWSVPATAGLFGDGAGAAILGPGKQGMKTAVLETFPEGYDASVLLAGGTRLDAEDDPDILNANRHFQMDGPTLFRLTRARFAGFVSKALGQISWQMDEIDCVVPHQASPRALAQMAKTLGVSNRIVDMAASHGNMIAASLPIALDHAIRTGRAQPGSKLLLLGTAAGISFGAAGVQL